MGRKNYYGSENYNGAETFATLFTIIEPAKKNELDPRTFLAKSIAGSLRGQGMKHRLSTFAEHDQLTRLRYARAK